MKILFNVENQKLKRIDNNSVVADSKNYLKAKFNILSDDWEGEKTAIFKNGNFKFHTLLNSDDECTVPWEVIKPPCFTVSLFAGDLITADEISISVKKSGYENGTNAPQDPTPDIYAQIMEKLKNISSGSVSQEDIAEAVAVYFAENPVDSGVSEEQVANLVNDYLAEESSDTSLWEMGVISNTTGSTYGDDSTTRIRTKDYIPSDISRVYITDADNYVMSVMAYDTDDNFVGAYYTGDFVKDNVGILTEFDVPSNLEYQYKISFRNKTSSKEITIAETVNVMFVRPSLSKLKADVSTLSNKVATLNTNEASNKIDLIRFAYTDIGLKSRELHIDGRYAYIGCFGGVLMKMDFGFESNPTVEWQVTLDAVNNINGIACDDKYLYVVDRDPKAWDGRIDGSTIGHLYVINKSDGSVVNTLELSGKGAGITLYDNYALVSMQIYGWAIYDISDVNNITKVYEHLQTDYNKGEFQKINVITLNNVPYVFIAGFDHGLTIWDISDITAPTLAHEFDLKALNLSLYGAKKEQCFDMVKVDNYLYMPIAPLSAYLTDTSIRRGIIRIDLSDMTKMDNDEFEYYPICLDDWAPVYGESDTNPNAIVRMGNVLLVNNAGLGLAMFQLNDDYSLTYLKTVKVTTDGVVRPMVATSDGRLVIAPDNSKGTDRVVAIYRPHGISY